MDTEEYLEHCDGLSKMLKRNDINGFYLFFNEIPENEKMVGVLGAHGRKNIPLHYQSILLLIETLSNLDLNDGAQIAVAKAMKTLIELIESKAEIMEE